LIAEEVPDAADDVRYGFAAIAGDLAKEEVLGLDRGGAFVEGVDLGRSALAIDR